MLFIERPVSIFVVKGESCLLVVAIASVLMVSVRFKSNVEREVIAVEVIT